MNETFSKPMIFGTAWIQLGDLKHIPKAHEKTHIPENYLYKHISLYACKIIGEYDMNSIPKGMTFCGAHLWGFTNTNLYHLE